MSPSNHGSATRGAPHSTQRAWHVLANMTVAGILLSGCADRRTSVAKDALQQQVATQSGGALTLTDFSKTNGVEANIGGVRMYTIEWTARITVNADVWKGGNAFVGYWSDFSVMAEQPGMWANLMSGGNAVELAKGATAILTGTSQLQKADNGWRVLGLEVKTSQLLKNTPRPEVLAQRQRQQEAARRAQEQAQAQAESRRAAAAEAAARQQEEERKVSEARAVAARAEEQRTATLIEALSREPCDEKTAKAMLDGGVDLRREDYNGRTALMLAARYGCTKVVQLLIQHHADLNHRNMWNMTALDWARRENRSDVVELLVKNGAK